MPDARSSTTPARRTDGSRPEASKPAKKSPSLTSRSPAARPRPDRPRRPARPGQPRRLPPRSELIKLALVAAGLLGVVIMSIAVFAAAVSTRPVVYTASTQVLYGDSSNSNILDDSQATGDPDRILATQAQVVVSDEVTTTAAATLNLSVADLVADTEVTTVPQSDVMVISVQAATADEAVRRATVLTDRYLEIARSQARESLTSQVQALEAPIQALRDAVLVAIKQNRAENAAANREALSGLLQQQAQLKAAAQSEQGKAKLLAAATTPDSPSSLSTRTGAVVGAAVGLVLATGLLLLLVWWRRPPHPRED